MKMLFTGIMLFCSWYAKAQINADTIKTDLKKFELQRSKRNQLYRSVRLPLSMIALGTAITLDGDGMINKYELREERQEALGSFHTSVDNYLQFAPIVVSYGLNALGIKAEHDFANRTALLIKSELFMVAMTFPLKQLSAVARPDTGERNSFPSGHTAQAFVAATFMHKEFGKKNPMYSVIAYGMAASVGLMRIANNRHWVSDVIAGAGIGILSTNLAYLTHQNKWNRSHRHSHDPRTVKKQFIVAPSYSQGTFGLSSVLLIR